MWSPVIVMRDGVRLAGRGYGGSGSGVLLLHGLAGHCGEWEATADWLRATHRVVALDQRGHGLSERSPADVSREACAADAIAVIDALGLAPVILVGQSLGGITALLTAAARPDLVRALVLVEALPGTSDREAPGKIGAWLDGWPVPFASREAAVEFFGDDAVGAGRADGLEQRADGWHPRFDREVMVASIGDHAKRSYWPHCDRLRCPVLVVLAEHGIIPRTDVTKARHRQPATRVGEVADSGHDLHLERPEALRDAMLAFFSAF
jgi:pimeloyl-ACP methyl ester carboxylesterase